MVETFNFPQNNLNSTKLEIYGQKGKKKKMVKITFTFKGIVTF